MTSTGVESWLITSGSDKTRRLTADQTRTADDVYKEIVDDYGVIRAQSRMLERDVETLKETADDGHEKALELRLRQMANKRLALPFMENIDYLADAGFAWKDIAELVGVSVPALRKWRQGGEASTDNRLAVAEIVAICELLADLNPTLEVAGWLATPLSPRTPITRMDLVHAHRGRLFQLAADLDADPEAVLDEVDPAWRSYIDDGTEIYTAPDGLPAIRITR